MVPRKLARQVPFAADGVNAIEHNGMIIQCKRKYRMTDWKKIHGLWFLYRIN